MNFSPIHRQRSWWWTPWYWPLLTIFCWYDYDPLTTQGATIFATGPSKRRILAAARSDGIFNNSASTGEVSGCWWVCLNVESLNHSKWFGLDMIVIEYDGMTPPSHRMHICRGWLSYKPSRVQLGACRSQISSHLFRSHPELDQAFIGAIWWSRMQCYYTQNQLSHDTGHQCYNWSSFSWYTSQVWWDCKF